MISVLRSLLALSVLLSLSCAGGGKESGNTALGRTPEGVVRALLDGIAARDQNAIENAINPIYATATGEVGIGPLIRLSQVAREMGYRNLDVRAEYTSEQDHARVFVTGRVYTDQGEAPLDGLVLLTSREGDRWYVTSPYSDYWSSLLRPPPSAWAQVQLDANPALPGVYVPPHPGADGRLMEGNDDRAHFANELTMPICSDEQLATGNFSSPLCYPSNPPTSGPHAANAAPFRIFTQPVGKEFLVHSMEHGAVVIWYNTANIGVVQRLTALTESNLQRGKLVILTPYPGMEPETVALTAWTRIDKFPTDQLDLERVQLFINIHERRFNPEGF